MLDEATLGQVEAALADLPVERGDIWLYRTLVRHASAAANGPTRRRVLQIDYPASSLPCGLEYLGA